MSFLPRTYLGAIDDKPFSLNVEKAKALLAEAGYADGFEVGIVVREAQERIEIAQSIQNTFGQAGIKVNITVGTAKQILGEYRARTHDIYVGAWGPDYPDPHNILIESPWLRGSGWKNEQFDDLIKTAINTVDQQARIRLYQQADRVAMAESPLIPLGYGFAEWLIKPWIRQYHPAADTIFSDPTAAIIEPH